MQLARSVPRIANLHQRKVTATGSRAFAMAALPSLVSSEWLQERINDPSVKILDGTWYLPNAGKNPVEEFKSERIPGSQRFDIDVVSNTSLGLPHMLPAQPVFEAAMDALGITRDTTVVVYDRSGIFSAPRVWWTFRVMGHEKVVVLEGGLPAWKSKGMPIDSAAVTDDVFKPLAEAAASGAQSPGSAQYKASPDSGKVRSMEEMMSIVGGNCQSEQVMDARGPGRFEGTEPEPRAGLKGGHMPGARNVPFPSMLAEGGMAYKSPEELQAVFSKAGIDLSKPLVASCGSGLTACVLALGAYQVTGKLNVCIYDGSWMEWGAHPETPVATGPA